MNEPIHIAITRRVLPGCEQEFEKKLAAFAQRSLSVPGSRGVQLLYPSPGSGSREYGALRSFATATDKEAFYNSDLYRQWLAEIKPLVEGDAEYREVHGLEAWFRDPSRPAPPRWKMAMLTWLVVWPVSMLIALLVKPILPDMHFVIESAIVSLGIVTTLTWILMPVVVKIARPWLHSQYIVNRAMP